MSIIASHKLAVIKTGAIIQKQFNVSYNQTLAILVYGMLQLVFNLSKTIYSYKRITESITKSY